MFTGNGDYTGMAKSKDTFEETNWTSAQDKI